MELFLLYLWLKINTLIGALVGAGIVFVIAAAICFLNASDAQDQSDSEKKWLKYAWRWLMAAPFSVAVSLIIPSKTDIAILVGASVALDMAKSPEGVKVGALLRGKVNEVLDEAIKEMTPKKP